MSNYQIKQSMHSRLGLLLVIVIFLLGVFFRFANLDNKIYWVDEVATSLRISGYTKEEVVRQLAERDVISIEELQKYQRLSPEKDLNDTLDSLMKSPEHVPLYFLMTRFWVQLFGDSVVVTRSLSVVLSLVALACTYWLCVDLFKSPLTGWIAFALLTVSPFYVAYAQEARPYSLWTVTILLSSVALLRAIRFNKLYDWGFYTITLILGLYTSLLFFFVVIGQIIYIFAVENFRFTKAVKNYLVAFSLGLIAFAPWLLVILQNFQRLQDNTTWMRIPMDLPSRIAIWIYSIVIIFVELPIYKYLNTVMIVRIIIDLSLLTIVGYSFYFLCLKAPKQVWLFVLTLTLVPTAILIITDLLLKGQGSTAPRYMIPCQLGIQLAVAYLVSNKVYYNYTRSRQQTWKLILVTLISIAIVSCILNLEKSPKYQKTRNLHNIPIAALVNNAEFPTLVAETKEVLDILSLSYILETNVQIRFLPKTNFFELINKSTVFLFNPSSALRDKLQAQQLKIEQVYKPNLLIPGEISLSLWTVDLN